MLPAKRWIAGLLAEDRRRAVRIEPGDLGGVETAETLLQLERAGERGRDCHLLVEHEADEQRQRLLRDQAVGLVVPGEVEYVGHDSILVRRGIQAACRIRSRRPRSLQPRPSVAGVSARRGSSSAACTSLSPPWSRSCWRSCSRSICLPDRLGGDSWLSYSTNVARLVVTSSYCGADRADDGSSAPDGARVPRPADHPTATQFQGTQFGGLSGFAYDQHRGVFYALSDDQTNVRFYTLRVDVSAGVPAGPDPRCDDVARRAGQPFAPLSVDPEGLALTKDDTLVITSEGFAARLIDPWVREFALDGRQLRSLPVPSAFLPVAGGTRGVRQNLGLRERRDAPNGRFLFTGTENALVQDGPPATVAAGSPARLLRYNLQTGQARPPVRLLDRSDRRAARAGDPVRGQRPGRAPAAEQRVPARDGAVVLGRRPGHRQQDPLYSVAIPGADNVNGFDSLATLLAGLRPVEKTLVLEPRRARPAARQRRRNGVRPETEPRAPFVVLVSDNNFAPAQFTQFLLSSAVDTRSELTLRLGMAFNSP